ncbi:hypothetical protein V8Z80_03250 [Orrella sp. JC864]|uniref:hypothetical protein n=1 Tax=Orrella sp. JC864 TaxID=3120298 RepID=UPI0030091CBB
MEQLPDDIYAQIEALSEAGNDASDLGEHADAIVHWRRALALLPEPRREWEAYEWLQASIGDAHYQMGDYAQAKDCLFEALNTLAAQENAFAHYMLGKAMWHLGEEPAFDRLMRAYMLEGAEIFETDPPEGPQMLAALRERGLLAGPGGPAA